MDKELTADEKKKRKKVIVIILIVIALLIITLVTIKIVKKVKEKKALNENADHQKKNFDNTQGEHPDTKTVTGNDNFPLEEGSEGKNVLYLQRALNKLTTYDKITEDGKFGHKTYLSVITGPGTNYYPVTVDKFTEILQKANAA